MKKILIPIDGSQRSIKAIEQLKTSFPPDLNEIILLMVCEHAGYITDDTALKEVENKTKERLACVEKMIPKYKVTKIIMFGKAGEKIIECSEMNNTDLILMTKSTKAGLTNIIGSTSTYVIKHTACNVMIVQEKVDIVKSAYRGLKYSKSEGTVDLRGQLSMKHSECILPSAAGKCVYHIEMTRGRIRLNHMSYNIESNEWDIAPANGQEQTYDITTGDVIDIPMEISVMSNKPDQIRVVNKNMKTEAVFKYKVDFITLNTMD